MKADSGGSKIYIRPEHIKHLTHINTLQYGPTATLPNNTKIQASAQGILPLHKSLTTPALIYPGLTNESLLSIGQLCDQGCVAIFDKYKLHILKDGNKF